MRLEAAFGRTFDDRYLALDTPREFARLAGERRERPRHGAGGSGRGHPLEPATPAAPVNTIHESLWSRADENPLRPHVYLREDDGTETTITYGRLRDEAAAVAGGLRERGVAPGDTVALMLPTGLDFLAAFQGILLAGGIPVPIYPPARLDRLEEYAARQSAILADAGVKVLLTVARARAVAALLRPRVPSLRDVATVRELADEGASWLEPAGRGSDPAFIQYTSGSTGAPKGVLLTHANLLANITAVGAALRMTPVDVGAIWLPLYHDMGLIGSWLFCMHAGLPIAIQSPLSFLSRPERWLWTIHDRRATLSPAPNFAYELCVKKIPDRALEGLDLSSLAGRAERRGAGEPGDHRSLREALRALRLPPRGDDAGVRAGRELGGGVLSAARAADRSSIPSSARSFERERRAAPWSGNGAAPLRFVSVGPAVQGHEVRIVDDAGREVADRTVGRLVFRGPSMTSGYFHKPEATAAIRVEGGFLDSGDLAYRADGEFYVTGRRKDLIIKAGRNLVPQEIEEIASTVEGIRKGCVVAFGIARPALGTEELVIVAETRASRPAAREALQAKVIERVATAIGVPPDTVVLARAGGRAQDVERQDPPRRHPRAVHRRARWGGMPAPRLRRACACVAGAAAAAVSDRAAAAAALAYAAYVGVLGVLIVGLFWPPVALLQRQSLAFALGRTAARWLFRLGGCRLRAEGVERLQAGPYVLACNHTSFADVLALMAMLPQGFVFLAKKEILGWPIIGSFIAAGRHLTVDREDAIHLVADAPKIGRALAEGTSVLIFPEGTFTASPGLRPFRLGAFQTAVDAGRPVVPMALRGARRVLRDKTLIPRPGPIDLWVGEPLHANGTGWSAMVDLRDRVAAAIAQHCGEPRLDIVAGGPPRRTAPLDRRRAARPRRRGARGRHRGPPSAADPAAPVVRAAPAATPG